MICVWKNVNIECESKVSPFCIVESDAIVLSSYERTNKALRIFKNEGWDIENHICPKCLENGLPN